MTVLDIRPLNPDAHSEFTAMVFTYLAEIAPDLPMPGMGSIASAWQDDTRVAFTLHSGDMIGFALITRLRDGTHEISEFYVAPDHRRAGIGARFAQDIVTRFPGRWRLGLAKGNPGARGFWMSALSSYTVRRGPPLTPHQTGSLHFTVKETCS